VLPSSGDSFPYLIQERGSQLGFVTHVLTYLRTCFKWNIVSVYFHYIKVYKQVVYIDGTDPVFLMNPFWDFYLLNMLTVFIPLESFLRGNRCIWVFRVCNYACEVCKSVYTESFVWLIFLFFLWVTVLISHEWFVSRLFGNSLWLVALGYYIYVTFLGYSCK